MSIFLKENRITSIRKELDKEKESSYWWLLGLCIFLTCLILLIPLIEYYRGLISLGLMGLGIMIWDLFKDIKKQTNKEFEANGVNEGIKLLKSKI